MKVGERSAYDANPARGSRFMGHAVHRATDRALAARFGDRFEYNASRGPDFFDHESRVYVELTTEGDLFDHIARYGHTYSGHPVVYATYK